jgi:hypothetical protein
MVSRFMVSFKQKSAPCRGVKKVEKQPIIITPNLLEWINRLLFLRLINLKNKIDFF